MNFDKKARRKLTWCPGVSIVSIQRLQLQCVALDPWLFLLGVPTQLTRVVLADGPACSTKYSISISLGRESQPHVGHTENR